jgi:hypothetical protein
MFLHYRQVSGIKSFAVYLSCCFGLIARLKTLNLNYERNIF